MVVDVDENGRVQFECMAAGPPEPTFLVKKTKPAPTQIKTTTVLIEYSAQQGSDGWLGSCVALNPVLEKPVMNYTFNEWSKRKGAKY